MLGYILKRLEEKELKMNKVKLHFGWEKFKKLQIFLVCFNSILDYFTVVSNCVWIIVHSLQVWRSSILWCNQRCHPSSHCELCIMLDHLCMPKTEIWRVHKEISIASILASVIQNVLEHLSCTLRVYISVSDQFKTYSQR